MGSVDEGCRDLGNDTLACGGAVGELQEVNRGAHREVVGAARSL